MEPSRKVCRAWAISSVARPKQGRRRESQRNVAEWPIAGVSSPSGSMHCGRPADRLIRWRVHAILPCKLQSSHSASGRAQSPRPVILPDAAESSLKTSSALRNAVAAIALSPRTTRERSRRVQPSDVARSTLQAICQAIDHRSDCSVLLVQRRRFGLGIFSRRLARHYPCRRFQFAKTRLSLNCRFRRPSPWPPRTRALSSAESDQAPPLSQRR